MDIFEMIEEAKNSEYGETWYSDKGPIHISKEGNLIPIKLKELPKYQPERSKREDALLRKICEENPSYYDPNGDLPIVLDKNGRRLSHEEIMK